MFIHVIMRVEGNQDPFQKAGALTKLGEMIEEGSTYQKAALWALYYLTVDST